MPEKRQTPGSRFPNFLARWQAVVDALLGKLDKPVNGRASQALDGTGVPKYQVQTDWAQVDNTKQDFIKNKPALNYLATPAGSTAQYIRGNGTLGTFATDALAAVTWSTLTGKPTTLAGYGITDAYPLTGNPSGFLTSAALASYLTVTAGDTRYQLQDSDLTAIAALATQSFGRGFLALADAASTRTYIGAATRAYIATASTTKSGAATTEGTIIPTGNGSLSIPSAIFDSTGYSFRFEAAGVYTNVLTGVVTLRVKIGSQVTLSAAVSFPVLSAKTWRASGIGTVRAGRVVYSAAMIEYDNGGSTDGVVFSSSSVTVAAGAQTVDFTAQWNLVLGGASVTVDQLFLDIVPTP